MAQQGGTDHPPSPSSMPTEDEDEKRHSSEWEVVERPVVDNKKKAGTSDDGKVISSQFKLDLGWGAWRTTIFAWDVNVRTTSS
jgi:hypothetical protein